MKAPIPEGDRRTPEFSGGTLATLADGRGWWFPTPRLRYGPARDAAGGIVLGAAYSFDDGYRDLYDQLVELDPDDAYEFWSLRLRIACHLLLRNYTLSDAELGRLLPVDFESEANLEMWRALTPILAARPPKPSPAG